MSTNYEFEYMGAIIKQFSNIFFSAFLKKDSDLLTKEQIKKFEEKEVKQMNQFLLLYNTIL